MNLQDCLEKQNSQKMKDCRKRFLVKQWGNKSQMKNGERQTFMHWKHLHLDYQGQLDVYINQLSGMAEHSFYATWNYIQHKRCKGNLESGEVVMVHDFAQNYLCQHQHEPQGLHWILPQVTHLVTHEVVHVSDDLKHDAHLVEKFQQVTLQVLKQHEVLIHKLVKFTDHAPSQYKSKTSFNYLTKSIIPTMHCFFGVRHGKGPCDACTGRVKQAITRLVKTTTEVVNSAKSFFEVAKEHLTREKAEPGKCVHFRQTFHYTPKIPTRPRASTLTPVPETRQLNCVCNNGKTNEVMTRKIVCCCTGCLRKTGHSDKSEYTDAWQSFNMQNRKSVKLNWRIWRTVISNLQTTLPPTWQQRLQQMHMARDYDALEQYIHSNPIAPLQVTCDQYLSETDRNRIDYIALYHLPSDAPQNYVPVCNHGDGNCFPHACSYLACKNEDMYDEFRVPIIYKLVLNQIKYKNNEYMLCGASFIHRQGTTVEQIAMFAEAYNPNLPLDVEKEYRTEVKNLCKDGNYMGFWQIAAATNILKHPINSVYPDVHRIVWPDMNRTLWCYDETRNRNDI